MSYLLEIPWEATKYFSLKYKGVLKPYMRKVDSSWVRMSGIYLFTGADLPSDLRDFVTDDFTFSRWQEDDHRLSIKQAPITPLKGSVIFKPRPHQLEAAKKIFKSYYTGDPGFLEADKTGLGKTLSTLAGVTAIAKKEGFRPEKKAKLLVVCPKGVIPVWRQTLHNYPTSTALMRVMVINYQQLNKLLTAPAGAKNSKRQRTKNRAVAKQGTPTVDWDFIIFDEAHYLKNYPSSAASMAAASIAKLNKTYVRGKSPYAVFSTATPGSSPLNFAMMANILARLLTNSPSAKTVTPDTWGPFLDTHGFAVKKGKVGYTWATVPWFGKNSDDPAERKKYEMALAKSKQVQRKDALRIGKALTLPQAPFIMRSPKDIAGWPEQQMVPLPLAMSSQQKPIYEEAWTRFRNWLKLTPAHSDPKGALVENLRYRQKSSLLKVDSMIDNIEDFVEGGNQVFISVEFIETLDAYKTKLEAKGIKVAEISGRNVGEREIDRIRFQKGDAQVVLCTVVAGISLHAGETLPDGSNATAAPRISVLHDIRQNPLDTLQSAGRAHRDGQNSITYFPYFEDTVDQRVVDSFVNKNANMKAMTGSALKDAEELEDIFRAAATT